MSWLSGAHRSAVCGLLLAGVVLGSVAQTKVRNVVFRCPGNPVLYTDAISEKEAKERGCRTIEGAPITIIQSSPVTRRDGAPVPSSNPSTTARLEPSARVEPSRQRARDTDRKAILAAELSRDEQVISDLRREYNNGEPERQGNERNYQKYLDRVAEMKMAISRKENDIAALKRELSKLPQ